MKVIKTEKDIANLELGESYTFDFPELPGDVTDKEFDAFMDDFDKVSEENNKLQTLIEEKFTAPTKEEKIWSTNDLVKDMKAEAKERGITGYTKMKEAELIEVLNG